MQKTQPRSLRLPDELLEQIDDYAKKLGEKWHVTVNRSDAIRRLLAIGLQHDPELQDEPK